jgi:predicted house-cleaning noncanonical NTP pyrophosphatase (MazG superfamily)
MEFIPTNHPAENEYPKLVRDNIPAIIKERTGHAIEQRIAENDEEFEGFLLKKIVEEANELLYSSQHDNLEEELADIIELIDTLLVLKKKTQNDIATVRTEKNKKNGAFKDRVIMLSKVEKPKE